MPRSIAPNKAGEIASNRVKLRTIDMRLAGALKKHATILSLAGSVAAASSPASAQQPAPMQRGGLAPPPPGSGPPPPAPMYPPYPNATQRQLETAEQSDSGRGLEFVYFDVSGGGQFISLDAFSANHWLFPPMSGVDTSSFGAYVSAAGGIRLLFLTLGPSFRFGTFADWDLWTLNLDLGWHIPLGNLEPYAFIGGGFPSSPATTKTFPARPTRRSPGSTCG